MNDPNSPGRSPADSSQPLSDRVRSLRLGSRDSVRPPRSRWLPWIFMLVCLLTTAAFGYRAYRVGPMAESASRPASDAEKNRDSASSSSPTTSVAGSGDVILQAKGYVIPMSLIQVSPKVGGQLVFISPRFEEGQIFTEGEVLARLEDIDYKAEYEQALFAHTASKERYLELKRTLPEEIKQAEFDLDESRQNSTQLRLELERNRRLSLGNALAQRELEQAKYSYEANVSRIRRLEATLRMIRDGRADSRLKAAEAEMKGAQALLDKAEWRYRNTWVLAPVTGTILSKKAEKGNIVNPAAFSSGISASLCEMADLTRLEIDLSIQERDVAAIKKGQPCVVMPEAYQNDAEFLAKYPQGYVGRVSRLMPTADRAKGAIPVRVEILDIPTDEAGKYLRPEMSALVSFRKMSENKVPADPVNTARR